jgi:hypothetical protein
MRRSIHEHEPWAAQAIFDAFLEAKQVGTAWLTADGTPYVGLPWLTAYLEALPQVMGRTRTRTVSRPISPRWTGSSSCTTGRG